MKKKTLWSSMLLMLTMLPFTMACGGDDVSNSNDQAVVDGNGTASNENNIVPIDDKNFYLDNVKYSVEEAHLVVSGYDKLAFKGVAKIVPSITYKGIYYEVMGIKEHAFYECTGLTSVTIPNSVKSIGNHAFQYCSSLTSIIIPNSVTSIDDYAFDNCTGLTSITIPNSVTYISKSVFYGCTGLTSVTIPNSVTSIGQSAFNNCINLTSITIPNSVTSISGWAFKACTSLASITIPNSVTSIGDFAFSGCDNLTSITIGSGVKTIGSYAFERCTELNDVNCYAEEVPTTDDDAFENSPIEYATLHVPNASLESYKNTAPWSGFGKILSL